MTAPKTAPPPKPAPAKDKHGLSPAELQKKLGDKHITGPDGSGGYAEPGFDRPKERARGKGESTGDGRPR